MGQVITKIYSIASREVKMYNIERRAEKVLSKEKPSPAPMYPSTVKELDRLKEENISSEYLQKKDDQLDDYLKKVYVTTPDPAPTHKKIEDAERPLPLSRQLRRSELNFGYSESEEASASPGKVSLKQALQFISDNQTDPETHSNTAIAAQYKLDITTTNDILEHFRMFNMHVKKKDVDPDTLSVYERMQLKVTTLSPMTALKVSKEIEALSKGLGKPIEIEEIKDIEETTQNESDIKKNSSSSSPSNKGIGENR